MSVEWSSRGTASMLKAYWAPLCALPILPACTQYAWETSVYYVSASGDDTNDGLTAASPWKTLVKVSTHNFQRGDKIFFRVAIYFQDFSTSIRLLIPRRDKIPLRFRRMAAGRQPSTQAQETVFSFTISEALKSEILI